MPTEIPKILYVYFRYPLYPGGCYLTEHLDSISELFSVTLLADHFPKDSYLSSFGSFDVRWVSRTKSNEYTYSFRLLRYIFNSFSREASIVNCIGPRGLLFGTILKFLYGSRLVCTIEMIPDSTSWLNRLTVLYNKLSLRIFPIDKIICWSHFHSEKYLYPWGLKYKVVIIPPGIQKTKRRFLKEAQAIRFQYNTDLFFTFVKPLYGSNASMALLILDALRILQEEYNISSKLMLFFRGEPRERFVRDYIKFKKLGGLVVESPFVSFLDVPKYINASDYILLPYTYSATVSRSLLEALSLGKVVVTSDLGEITRYTEDSVNVFVVTPNPEELAKTLFRLYNLPEQILLQVGCASRQLIADRFDLELVSRSHYVLYHSLLLPSNSC